jgi:cell pole-organizing protein PopZ
MAQASSVQREPSMEEILASIRRIIEDSDSGRRPPEEQTPRSAAGPAAPAAKVEVETFRAELGPVAETAERRAAPAAVRSPEPAQVTEFAPKAFRLAEVQAQVAREAAAQPKAPVIEQPKALEADNKPITLADVQREMAREALPPMRPTATEPAAAYAPPATLPAKPEMRTAPVPPLAGPKGEQPAPQAGIERRADALAAGWKQDEAGPKPTAIAASLDAVAKPIISPMAGRQVAAAFGELSEAFAQRSKKTFDDLAEQMLRPMLQDWLDNNLPVLVERLVREEIERVARGV